MERGSSGAHRSRRSRRSHLIPVIDRAEQAVGTGPRRVLADAGDRSEENFERLRERNIDGFISPGREGKAPNRTQLPETKAMKRRLGTKRGRAT
jgi:hypothetical protein